MDGIFLDTDSLAGNDLNMSALIASLNQWEFRANTQPSEVVDVIANATVVVTNKVVLDAATISSAKKLRLICVAATGFNNVNIEAAKNNNISVCNVRNYAGPSVAQHVFSLVLAISNQLFNYRTAVQQGAWNKSSNFALLDYPILELAGKTIGIVGYGNLGQAVAKMAEAFGMKVIIAARQNTPAEKDRLALTSLLKQADVISLHCPLTKETHNLIGKQELAMMQPHAILINAARGGIIDEVALVKVLENREIGGAGIDVLTSEPPSAGNPLLEIDLPNLVVTPHIAWATKESRQRMVEEIAKNIQAYTNGKRRNCVTE